MVNIFLSVSLLLFTICLQSFGEAGPIGAPAGTEISSSGQPAGSIIVSDGAGGSTYQTLSPLELDQVTTPANPSSGSVKLYFKSDDKLYKLTSAGVESEIGAGGGGGISIGGAVSGGTANYSLFVDGSGNLAQSSDFQFDNSAKKMSLGGGAGSVSLQMTNTASGSSSTDGIILSFNGTGLTVNNQEAGSTRLLYQTTGVADSGAEHISVHGEGTTRFRYNFYQSSGTQNVAGTMALMRSRGTLASPTAIQTLDTLGTLSFGGYDGSAWARPASMTSFSEAGWTGTDRSSAIQFATSPVGASAGQAAFRILGNGNIQFRRGQTMGVYHVDNAAADASKGYDIELKASNKTAGTGNGGDVLISGGASTGGTKGGIKFQSDAELVGSFAADGLFSLTKVGGGLSVKEGSNATMGTATMTAGSVTVNTTKVTASSRIFAYCNDANGGTPGASYVSARSAGTSFTLSSTSVVDTCVMSWVIIEPN